MNDSTLYFIFQNVTFANVTGGMKYSNKITSASALFVNCTFENNTASPLHAEGSKLIFQGHNTFNNNSAASGGALYLINPSYMYLKPHTQILFTGNHADNVGGAIYIESSGYDRCFFHADSNSTSTIEINFYGNTATFGGPSLFQDYCVVGLCKHFHNFFNLEANPFAIASYPVQVCFCEDGKFQPNCSYSQRSITAFPGQEFPLHLVIARFTKLCLGLFVLLLTLLMPG
jgi:predicted outer membrane repeat protein